MVGADLAAIELRMLAHYLARYDDGAYADIVHNSDPHQVSADRIGISRKQVKTVTYAFIYGAGFEKIGTTYDPSLKGPKAAKKGKEIHKAFLDSVPGLEQLVAAVKNKVRLTGYVNSIDGRKISSDSEHKALNRLLQSGAGVVAKRWMVVADQRIHSAKLQAHQLAFIHDELQFTSDSGTSTELAHQVTTSAQAAGEFYHLRVPIVAEAKIGNNWAEVH
jgi:DNA polymerase I-like protein with 3'-5' exonuclease and polymerase domains